MMKNNLKTNEQLIREVANLQQRLATLEASESRQTENRLRALSHRLVQIQEEERQTIARQLHDQVGQSLTVLKLLLDKAARSPAENVLPSLREAQSLTNELMVQVRNLSLDLRPSMLDDLGLLPALLWYFERFAARTQLEVNFEHNGLQRHFPLEVSTAAYRIVQEAVSNIVRHAGVSQAVVRAWVHQDKLWIQVEDRGAGFEQATMPVSAAAGLYGMQERANLLGGKLTIESVPGTGTTVLAELPLPGDGK